jgi:hypothetical protein
MALMNVRFGKLRASLEDRVPPIADRQGSGNNGRWPTLLWGHPNVASTQAADLRAPVNSVSPSPKIAVPVQSIVATARFRFEVDPAVRASDANEFAGGLSPSTTIDIRPCTTVRRPTQAGLFDCLPSGDY